MFYWHSSLLKTIVCSNGMLVLVCIIVTSETLCQLKIDVGVSNTVKRYLAVVLRVSPLVEQKIKG